MPNIPKTDKEMTDHLFLNKGADTMTWFLRRFRLVCRDMEKTGEDEEKKDPDPDVCRLILCLKGGFNMGSGSVHEDLSLVQGSCGLCYHPGCPGCENCRRNDSCRVLELVCPVPEILAMLDGTGLGRELALAVRYKKPFHVRRSMRPRIYETLVHVLETPERKDGALFPLVMAKVMETFWDISRSDMGAEGRRVPPDIFRALVKARRMLEENMADPPNLHELASASGMSLTRFKAAFPKVYGMPPFAYLRDLRMEKARHLLEAEGQSVTEVSYEVGYNNLSHFAKAFQAHFGVLPSMMQKMKKLT